MIYNEMAISQRLDLYRNGAKKKSLRVEGNMRIHMVQKAEIKTSLSCTIEAEPDIDLLSDRLHVIQIVDGVEYPVGEFIATTVSTVSGQGGARLNIEAYDQTILLQQASTGQTFHIAKGTKYLDAIKAILTECGITREIEEASDLVISTDREDWGIGTSYISIVNTLLSEMNYEALWFDKNGFARLGKKKTASSSVPTQKYEENQYSIIKDGVTTEMDTYTAANVFTAIVSSPDESMMVATAVNDSPMSAISTVNRGRRIHAPVEYVDDIANQDTLQDYVDNLKNESMLSTETVIFSTAPIPSHQVGEIVALQTKAVNGIYQETEWELVTGFGGEYTHKARRLVFMT